MRITPDQLGDEGEAVVGRVAKLTQRADRATSSRSCRTSDICPPRRSRSPSSSRKRSASTSREHPSSSPASRSRQTAVRSYPFGRLAAHVLGYTGLIDADQYDGAEGSRATAPTTSSAQPARSRPTSSICAGERGKQKLIVNADGETIQALGTIPPTPGDDLAPVARRPGPAARREGARRGHGRTRELPTTTMNGNVPAGERRRGGRARREHRRRRRDGLESRLRPQLVRARPHAAAEQVPHQERERAVGEPRDAADLHAGFDLQVDHRACGGEGGLRVAVGLLRVRAGTTRIRATSRAPCSTTGPTRTSATCPSAHALEVSCDTVFDAFGVATSTIKYVPEPARRRTATSSSETCTNGGSSRRRVSICRPRRRGSFPTRRGRRTARWPEPLRRTGWVPGGDILTMIGSGYVQVTPLQLAAGLRGDRERRPPVPPPPRRPDPERRDGLRRRSGSTATAIARSRTTPQQLALHPRALCGASSARGTAQCAFAGFPTSQIAVAGKTGTAEREPGKQDTSWFASMVGPDPDHPQYVIVTMVEQGGFGGQTAAPITRQVIDALYPDDR